MVLTTSDRDRLIRLLKAGTGPAADGAVRTRLSSTLHTAMAVEPAEIAPTIVTMNSVVTLIDIDSGLITKYTLVWPADADVDRMRISVLTPIGAALVGRAEREIIAYDTPIGTRRLYVQKVLYQPESHLRARMADPPAA